MEGIVWIAPYVNRLPSSTAVIGGNHELTPPQANHGSGTTETEIVYGGPFSAVITMDRLPSVLSSARMRGKRTDLGQVKQEALDEGAKMDHCDADASIEIR